MSLFKQRGIATPWLQRCHAALATRYMQFKNSYVTHFPWCLAKETPTFGKRKRLCFPTFFNDWTLLNSTVSLESERDIKRGEDRVSRSVFRGTVRVYASEEYHQTILLMLLAQQRAYRRSARRCSASFSTSLYIYWVYQVSCLTCYGLGLSQI